MPKFSSHIPDLMPVLSVGRHRSPKRGACFMEYASHLAGERWTDHPTCTHPAIASLARAVNDCTSDEGRAQLLPLIPTVIGLHGSNERVRLTVGVRASSAALPVASESRQRAIAVGLAHCDTLLEVVEREPGDNAYATDLRAVIRSAFELAPAAERWATAFLSAVGTGSARLDSWTVDKLVALSVIGIAEACVPDSDERLLRMLSSTIEDCVAAKDAAVAPVTRTRGRVYASA
jgi:hypothetical protein